MNTLQAPTPPPQFRDQIRNQPVLPIVALENAETAVAIADALVAGGLQIMEVPLTSASAPCIRAIARHVPQMLVGAGMLSTRAHILEAEALGASFVTTPGTTATTLTIASDLGLPLLPGATTFSELMIAAEHDIALCRLFPVDLTGTTSWGLNWLRAAQVVLPQMQLIAAGGINLRNAHEFLSLPNVTGVTGTWVVPQSFVSAANWRGVTELAFEATQLAKLRPPRV